MSGNNGRLLPVTTVQQLEKRAGKHVGKFRLDGILPMSGLVLWVGASQVGKSRLLASIAFHLCAGKPFADLSTTKSRVLWLALEHGDAEVVARNRENGHLKGAAPLYVVNHDIELLESETEQLVIATAKHHNTDVIVIDCLRRTHRMNENESVVSNDLIHTLRNLAKERLVVVIHHEGKAATGPRGSSDFAAGFDTVVRLSGGAKAGHHSVRVDARHHSTAPSPAMTFTLRVGTKGELRVTKARGAIGDNPSAAKQIILAFCRKPRSSNAILRELRNHFKLENGSHVALLDQLRNDNRLSLQEQKYQSTR